MDSAKAAVTSFLGRGGHHDTEVDEQVNPAVTSETIKPHRHEETTQAVDREIHQDHYHTTVQPLQHKEVLPEQHTHNLLPTQERTFEHGDSGQIKERIATEAAQFKDSSRVVDTTHSQSAAPAVTGEHVHHHVHEVVQPVIHKETLQPETVHTVIPVHETHYAPSEHHGISSLPVKTMDEFKTIGGTITGGSRHHEEYEGHPKKYNSEMQMEQRPVDVDPVAHDGPHDLKSTGHVADHEHEHDHSRTVPGGASTAAAGLAASSTLSSHPHTHHSGPHSSGTANQLDPRVDSDRDGSHLGSGTTTGTGITGATGTSGVGSHSQHTGPHTSGVANQLDPRVDSSRDGSDLGSNVRSTGAAGYGETGVTGSTVHDHSTTGGLSSHTSANKEAMGSGVAGVAAGAAAADLGRDHVRAGHNTDMTSRDVSSTTGGAGSGLTGTSLGGRSDGNTVSHATESATSGLHGSTHESRREPSNLSESRVEPTRSHHHDETSRDDAQHSKQGKDPALVGEKISKLTGSGADGSHSAVFGLTPDGHTYDDTRHTATSSKPVDTKDTEVGRSSTSEGNDASRAAASSGVAGQLNDPRVAEKGHGGEATTTTSNTKPGAGMVGGEQGTGTVRPGENSSGAATKDKMNPLTDADHDGKAGVMD